MRQGHERLLGEKRKEVFDILCQCRAAVIKDGDGKQSARGILDKADRYYAQKQEAIGECKSLALLDGLVPQMLQYKDDACGNIEVMTAAADSRSGGVSQGVNQTEAKKGTALKKMIKPYNRQIVFPAKCLESEEDIDVYVEKVREQLKQLLKGCDGIQLR